MNVLKKEKKYLINNVIQNVLQIQKLKMMIIQNVFVKIIFFIMKMMILMIALIIVLMIAWRQMMNINILILK